MPFISSHPDYRRRLMAYQSVRVLFIITVVVTIVGADINLCAVEFNGNSSRSHRCFDISPMASFFLAAFRFFVFAINAVGLFCLFFESFLALIFYGLWLVLVFFTQAHLKMFLETNGCDVPALIANQTFQWMPILSMLLSWLLAVLIIADWNQTESGPNHPNRLNRLSSTGSDVRRRLSFRATDETPPAPSMFVRPPGDYLV